MPFKGNYMEIREETSIPGAKGTSLRVLISEKEGAPNFRMRLFEVKRGGYTPFHAHREEHEVFVTEGEGEIVLEGSKVPLKPGDFALVSGSEMHQFRNRGQTPFRFICCIPLEGKARGILPWELTEYNCEKREGGGLMERMESLVAKGISLPAYALLRRMSKKKTC